jgi:protein-L-isoaspartate(D-aspartate) O-methyltransferase
MRSSSEMRRRLVEQLRGGGYVHDARIMAAFRDVPREVFLPEQLDRFGLAGVYRDDAIITRRDPITRLPTSSSSQPAIMSLMLEMLGVEPGHNVVEIGTGTGYNAAILARLVGPTGRVVSLDIEPDVVCSAASALRSIGAPAHVLVADGATRLPLAALPVDRLEVTASSSMLPAAWHEQLAPRGRLVVPLRLSEEPGRAHAITALVKVAGGFDSVAVTTGGFMPLRQRDGSPVGLPAGAERPTPLLVPKQEDGEPDPAPLTRGPAPGIRRDDVARLRLHVRYPGAARPPVRWDFERPDHWIGADLAGNGTDPDAASP